MSEFVVNRLLSVWNKLMTLQKVILVQGECTSPSDITVKLLPLYFSPTLFFPAKWTLSPTSSCYSSEACFSGLKYQCTGSSSVPTGWEMYVFVVQFAFCPSVQHLGTEQDVSATTSQIAKTLSLMIIIPNNFGDPVILICINRRSRFPISTLIDILVLTFWLSLVLRVCIHLFS